MRQLARREAEPPSLLESFVRRLRELTVGDGGGDLRETIEELITETQDAGASLSLEERALVRNALEFGALHVDDVMVPRADMKGIEVGAAIHEVAAALQAAGHSRLVVYRGSLDDVLGVVHIKDLLPFWGDGERFKLEEAVRQVLVVPPSMRLLDLLVEMRKSRNHVAVVVDEFGGIDGLVTIGDVVEQLVGELQDEHDRSTPPQLTANADGSFDADGRIDLEEVEERLGVRLLGEDERDEADTLGGLIFGLVDRVPARGEVVQHPSGFSFEVLEADPRRIKRIRIRPPAAPAAQDGAEDAAS